jgi:hypothetical protein
VAGKNVPEGLAVISLLKAHWRRMGTANPIECTIQKEAERLATAILFVINEARIAAGPTLITMPKRDG